MLDYVPFIMNEPLNVWVAWVVFGSHDWSGIRFFVLTSSRSFCVNLLASHYRFLIYLVPLVWGRKSDLFEVL